MWSKGILWSVSTPPPPSLFYPSDSCGKCFPFRTGDWVPDPPLTTTTVSLHPQLEGSTLQPLHYRGWQGDGSLADCFIIEFRIQHLVDYVHLIYVLTILFHDSKNTCRRFAECNTRRTVRCYNSKHVRCLLSVIRICRPTAVGT